MLASPAAHARVARGEVRSARSRRARLAAAVACAGAATVVTLSSTSGWVPARPATSPSVAVPRLLTAADLGPGWTATHVGALAAEPAGCFRPRANLIGSSPASLVGVLLAGPAGLPEVDELAATYASSAKALSGFEAVAATLHGCATVATPAGTANITPQRLSVERYSYSAALVTLGRGDQAGGADFVAVRRDTGVVLLVYGTSGSPDAAAAGRLAASAIQRLGP